MAAEKSVAELLAEVFRRGGMKRPLKRAQLVLMWPRIAGAELGRFTRAGSFRDGVLYVDTTDSETAMHLSLQRTRFIGSFHDQGHRELRDIKFRPGRIERAGDKEPQLPAFAAEEDLLPLQQGLEDLELPTELMGAALNAAGGIARTRTLRRQLGWKPCTVCSELAEDGHMCLSCRRYSGEPAVLGTVRKLVQDPQLDTHWLTREQREVASWLARQQLTALMQSLLPHVVADASARPQLELLAGNWLSLATGRPVAELSEGDWRGLPERIRRLLGHG